MAKSFSRAFKKHRGEVLVCVSLGPMSAVVERQKAAGLLETQGVSGPKKWGGNKNTSLVRT